MLKLERRLFMKQNLYITQRHRRVTPVTEQEFFSFLGINILMGYHSLPSISLYWNNGHDVNIPIVSNAMARNRFSQILSNLHLNNNTTVPRDNKDRVFKIRPFIDGLNKNFVKLYNVNEHISIDESMILFKGR